MRLAIMTRPSPRAALKTHRVPCPVLPTAEELAQPEPRRGGNNVGRALPATQRPPRQTEKRPLWAQGICRSRGGSSQNSEPVLAASRWSGARYGRFSEPEFAQLGPIPVQGQAEKTDQGHQEEKEISTRPQAGATWLKRSSESEPGEISFSSSHTEASDLRSEPEGCPARGPCPKP